MAGYLAYIMPLEGSPGRPDNSLPGIGGPVDPGYGVGIERPSHPIALPPGSISGTPEHPIYTPPSAPGHPSNPIVLPPNSVGGTPEHPIYYPPNVWPPGGYPAHPIAPGGGPSQGPGFPTNPIAPGGQPPGFWGGVAPPGVDNGLPVPPTTWPPEPIPPLPPELSSQVVVAVHKPGQDWVVKSYPVGPDQGLPQPPAGPSQGLPGQPPRVDNTLPPSAQPRR